MNEGAAPADADAQRWACATLGVAEHASAEAIGAAFLKQVGESDFYPPADSVVAWQSLTGATATDPRARRILSQRVNEELRSEIEQFAARFFSLPCEERVQQWFQLNTRCPSSSALAARLAGLSAGLHIDRDAVLASLPAPAMATTEAAPSERALAEKVFEFFVLRPVDRAERQQEVLEAWQPDFKSWQVSARKLKKQFPKIAGLDTEFIDTLVDTPKPTRHKPSTLADLQREAPQSLARKKVGALPWTFIVFLMLMASSFFSRCAQESKLPQSRFPLPQNRNPVDLNKQLRDNLQRLQQRQQANPPAKDEQLKSIEIEQAPLKARAEELLLETQSSLRDSMRERTRLPSELDQKAFPELPGRVSPAVPRPRIKPKAPRDDGDEPVVGEQP